APKSRQRSGPQGRSSLGPAPQKSAVSGFDRQVRCESLAPRFFFYYLFPPPKRSGGKFRPNLRHRPCADSNIATSWSKILPPAIGLRLSSRFFQQNRAGCASSINRVSRDRIWKK